MRPHYTQPPKSPGALRQVRQLTENQYHQILRKTMILDKVDKKKKDENLKYEIE